MAFVPGGSISGNTQTVTVFEIPVADAGSGGTSVCNSLDFTTSAVPTVGTGTWSVFSGPGAITGAVPSINDPAATLTLDTYGTYALRWTEVNGGICSDFDDITVNFYEDPTADADGGTPVLDAACDALNVNLQGIGYTYLAPPNVNSGTRQWTYQSGPDVTPTFADDTDPTTNVAVDNYGVYVFRFTETNGNCSDFEDVTVRFFEEPTSASAGGDIQICNALTTSFAGTEHTYLPPPDVNSGTQG